jgi:hypothetical protein
LDAIFTERLRGPESGVRDPAESLEVAGLKTREPAG